ncbi:Nitrogen assimilation transcription factor nit-4 [Sporothrix epigloea]|uniref:Nitrogen assimilation transcription factor nit-4 n=1 Tax=Sporothrix epigloea TaxID=1892477 RepID=A0ABP0DPI4_9PEZI
MKAQSSTLQILIEAILNADEDDVPAIVKKIRTCDSLDAVAESIVQDNLRDQADSAHDAESTEPVVDSGPLEPHQPAEGESDLARKMGELRLENGSVRFIGGTSHLIHVTDLFDSNGSDSSTGTPGQGPSTDCPATQSGTLYPTTEDAINSWTSVTSDTSLIIHLMNMYFNWHYTYFATLSKSLFYRDFLRGRPEVQPKCTVYCTTLLVNAMLSLGCHFTAVVGAFAVPGDSRTKGDHFFAEAKRLIVENDEYEKPKLATVQALALMSVREAGCAREAKGWVYSGMSFRMAQDIGLNFDAGAGGNLGSTAAASDSRHPQMSEDEIDARRITFWGCFLFDKAWSNYLGRLPQLPKNSYNVPKYDVFPDEDAEFWSPFTDSGFDLSVRQPSRTRAIGLQLSKLCEISSDLLLFFYHPNHIGRSNGKTVELRKLSELHRRLEDWRRELPVEFEPKEGQLPNVLLTLMFYHLQYIHLFRPFLKYTPKTSPLPAHISPRRICTSNAGSISKLMRLYKKVYNLRQICNIAVYMIHSACTIHLLNLPEKTAKRNIIHGVKQLEEIAEDWLCGRRTLSIISVLARKWDVELPEEALVVLQRSDNKYGTVNTADVPSPNMPSGPGLGTFGPNRSPHHWQNPENKDALTLGAGPSPTTLLPEAVVNVEQPGYGAFHSTSMPGLLGQSSRQSPALHDLSSLDAAAKYSSGLAGDAPATANGCVPLSPNYNALAPGNFVGSATSAAIAARQPIPTSAPWTLPSSVSRPLQDCHLPPSSYVQPPAQPGLQSMYGVDSQEWLIKDGVDWQYDFEAWNFAQHGPQVAFSPTVPQQQEQRQQQHSMSHAPASTANKSTLHLDNGFPQFRDRQSVDLSLTYDGLGGLSANLDNS